MVRSTPLKADVLTDLADSFGLERSIPENPVPTFYSSDPNHANTVIDLMFTASSIGQLISHQIALEHWLPSDHAPLLIDLPIAPELICHTQRAIKRNSKEEDYLLTQIIGELKEIK
ncbi:hypothetical protein NP233_g11821 [Leucocoprinus birnbaumii]|uniref:Endonuclease/exonuclease/phosphatase domain-containing protein n=1 Tax=Leucocoprinus birnbaumii TaxID=56174 RepID=A0AAD5VG90_9AGAR|nr:hypothetical protein NP233_g11821 [Leucocoprinus birnbaumii]